MQEPFQGTQILKLGEVIFAQPSLMDIFKFGRWENGSNEKIMSHDKTVTAGHIGHLFNNIVMIDDSKKISLFLIFGVVLILNYGNFKFQKVSIFALF